MRNAQLFPKYGCGTRKRRERQAGVCGIKQSVKCCAASVHLFGHRCLGKILSFHFLVNLPRDYTLNSHCCCFVQYASSARKSSKLLPIFFAFIIYSSFCLLLISILAVAVSSRNQSRKGSVPASVLKNLTSMEGGSYLDCTNIDTARWFNYVHLTEG